MIDPEQIIASTVRSYCWAYIPSDLHCVDSARRIIAALKRDGYRIVEFREVPNEPFVIRDDDE